MGTVLGVHVVSLLTRREILFGADMRQVWQRSDALGFKLQALPIKGMRQDVLRQLPVDAVVAIEPHGWNYGRLHNVIRRHAMDLLRIPVSPGNEPPKVYDWLLFGNRIEPIRQRANALREMFPDAAIVSHDGVANAAFELSPEALMHMAEEAQCTFAEMRDRVFRTYWRVYCLDYRHLTRPDRYGDGNIVCADPIGFVESLQLEQIVVVHVNPESRVQLESWLAGKQSGFADFFDAVAQKLQGVDRKVPVIAELYPLWSGLLPEVRARMMEVFREV